MFHKFKWSETLSKHDIYKLSKIVNMDNLA